MKVILLIISLMIPGFASKQSTMIMPDLDTCLAQAKIFLGATKDIDFDFKRMTANAICSVNYAPLVCEKGDYQGEAFGKCVNQHAI